MGQVLISFVYFAKFNSDAGISQNRNFPSDGLTKKMGLVRILARIKWHRRSENIKIPKNAIQIVNV